MQRNLAVSIPSTLRKLAVDTALDIVGWLREHSPEPPHIVPSNKKEWVGLEINGDHFVVLLPDASDTPETLIARNRLWFCAVVEDVKVFLGC